MTMTINILYIKQRSTITAVIRYIIFYIGNSCCRLIDDARTYYITTDYPYIMNIKKINKTAINYND